MRFGSLLVFALLTFVTACSQTPSGKSYTPPENPGGRMCTLQCGEARAYCDQSCNLKFRSCIRVVQTQAMVDYDKYTQDQYAAHQPIEFKARDFERDNICDTAKNMCSDDCETTYGVCYKNCGGTITAPSCSFLCF